LLGGGSCVSILFVVRALPDEELANRSKPSIFMGEGNNSQRKETKKPKKPKDVKAPAGRKG